MGLPWHKGESAALVRSESVAAAAVEAEGAQSRALTPAEIEEKIAQRKKELEDRRAAEIAERKRALGLPGWEGQ